MNDREKSDPGIVAEKPTNKPGRPGAELVEPRPGTEGNANRQSTLRTQGRAGVTQALERVRQAAKHGRTERFTALPHHIHVDLLQAAFVALKRRAAAGVDGVTWEDYEVGIELRLTDLHDRVHGGGYRPQPSRRTYIPKADGRRRPLAIAALEDKIVQGATAMVLSAIYEEDFLGLTQTFGNETQQAVAATMAQCIVDGLEAIEVTGEHCGRMSAMLSAFDGLVEALTKQTPVRQSGEIIM